MGLMGNRDMDNDEMNSTQLSILCTDSPVRRESHVFLLYARSLVMLLRRTDAQVQYVDAKMINECDQPYL